MTNSTENSFDLVIQWGGSSEEDAMEYSFKTKPELAAFLEGAEFGVDQFPAYTECTDSDTTEYKTEDQKQAFIEGVNDSDGWSSFTNLSEKKDLKNLYDTFQVKHLLEVYLV